MGQLFFFHLRKQRALPYLSWDKPLPPADVTEDKNTGDARTFNPTVLLFLHTNMAKVTITAADDLVIWLTVTCAVAYLSGVPDYFDRNKILSGYDLSHYQVPHCIRVFFYFVWFVFIHHNFQLYFKLCTYCNILDINLS